MARHPRLRSGTVLRWTLATVVLGLSLAAAAADYTPYQRSTDNARKLEATTKSNIERIQGETRQALSAQGAVRRRADGVDFSYGADSDNIDAPSSLATRPLSRSAPPPAGAEWIARAQQAWGAGPDTDAAEYLRRASEAGSAGATRALGSAYAEGIGVPQSAGTGLALYRQAATMGDTEALLLLGRAYAPGIGAPVDLREALDWYTKASRRSRTRERGERGVAAVRELARLETQLASLERCEKTGVCEPQPSTGATSASMDRP
jgi:TPR repeat protein